MGDVTEVLAAAVEGDVRVADELLPLVYNELRRLAAKKMSRETPGQTLDATALVHEAYLRLVSGPHPRSWHDRGHFFAAAAEAMRRILIERAHRRMRQKNGGDRTRILVDESEIAAPTQPAEVIAVDEALDKLEAVNPLAAKLVKLRYFAGFDCCEAADLLGISRRKASQVWTYARTWLLAEIERE